MPAATLDALGRDARAAAGYRTHTWRDEIPAERLDDVAVLWTRMSTDAPSAGLDQHEERWDAARVRDHLADLADRFQHVLVTVAEYALFACPGARLTRFVRRSILQPCRPSPLRLYRHGSAVTR